jgi:hypothetical protein
VEWEWENIRRQSRLIEAEGVESEQANELGLGLRGKCGVSGAE